MKTPHDSLSILLCVRNAQAELARDVEHLVETAAELTSQFELVIIDDGSTDATEEIAWELSSRYAQVALVRQPRTLGTTAALRAGLNRSSGDYLLLIDGPKVSLGEAVAAAWRSRPSTQRARTKVSPGWTDRLRTFWCGRPGSAGTTGRATSPLRLLKRTDLAGLEPLVAAPRTRQFNRPHTRVPAPTLAAADSAAASRHNQVVS